MSGHCVAVSTTGMEHRIVYLNTYRLMSWRARKTPVEVSVEEGGEHSSTHAAHEASIQMSETGIHDAIYEKGSSGEGRSICLLLNCRL